ncbi:MAG: putative hydrolase [Jatrophihabitans sp.]|nr:putative hydrolase [Jatrophihabitans sp.]
MRLGHDWVSYLEAGPRDGPPVLLLHGLLSDATTWELALPALASHGLRVIALDLPGHGDSAKPRGTYLLDDFAIALDRVLPLLGMESATVVGHSFGGAITVHFGYHYPHRVQRQVLVSAGGLGREVNVGLRLLTVDGAEAVVGAVLDRRIIRRLLGSQRLHRAAGLTEDRLVNLRRIFRSLADPPARSAFFASARGVIEPSGQRGSFHEMEYLVEHLPTMLVWSSQDSVIPVAHARDTHLRLPQSRLVVFPGGGHEPHRRNAQPFADAVASFVYADDPDVPGGADIVS